MTKFEIATATLLMVFFLGQSADFLKYYLGIHRRKRAVLDEVSALAEVLIQRIERIEYIADEMSTRKLIGIPSPGRIHTIIFDAHFSDIAPHFGKDEREEILDIHSTVNLFNEEVEFGNRNDVGAAKKSFLKLYHYGNLGQASATHFLQYRGKKLFKNKTSRIKEIGSEVQRFAEKYEI